MKRLHEAHPTDLSGSPIPRELPSCHLICGSDQFMLQLMKGSDQRRVEAIGFSSWWSGLHGEHTISAWMPSNSHCMIGMDWELSFRFHTPHQLGVSQTQGYHFGGPYNKNYNIVGSILGSPYLGKLPTCPKKKMCDSQGFYCRRSLCTLCVTLKVLLGFKGCPRKPVGDGLGFRDAHESQ